MEKFTIFKKEYSSLFTKYGYGVTTIDDILHSIGLNLTNLHTDEAREKGLEVIHQQQTPARYIMALETHIDMLCGMLFVL